MNLNEYYEQRQKLNESQPRYRNLCTRCLQPEFGCYCAHVKRFNAGIEFVILIHPIEVRRRIATGRMSYLSLENSYLIAGEDYSDNQKVNELLADPAAQNFILYPGRNSTNLTGLPAIARQQLFEPNKKLRLFVIDGTWAKAKTTVRLSQNLQSLPKICFSPSKPSNFKVRKQPQEHCLSTIEAIHEVIELLGNTFGYDPASRQHDGLLEVFDVMVQRQLDFMRIADANPEKQNYRRFVRATPA